jgi:hypothetical protein
MFKSLVGTAVIAASVMSGSVYANTTNASFIDVVDSVEFNGWNNLTRSNPDVGLIATGYTANVAGSSDAVFTRTAGSSFAAGAGLYDPVGADTYTLTDNTIAAGLTSVVFQSNSVAGGTGTGLYGVSLTYTVGGNNYVASLLDTNVQSSTYKYFSWDLSGISGITAISVQFSTEQHANSVAFQLDQVAAAVPEPSEYALLLAGLSLVGFAARRKQA